MFKLFNVSESTSGEVGEIEVRMNEEEEGHENVGQVALDVLDAEDSIVIVAPLAGLDTENIDISVSRNILTISGERTKPDIYNEASRILVEECFFGPFSRSVILPENLKLDRIKAMMENNLLMIEIPKIQFASKSVKIDKLEK